MNRESVKRVDLDLRARLAIEFIVISPLSLSLPLSFGWLNLEGDWDRFFLISFKIHFITF